MGLLSELRRRNVDRMAVLYVVAAWLIMQVAEVLIGLRVVPPSIGPATFILLAIGFPISLVISWYFEITPEGLKPEKDVDRTESITRITGRRMDFIVISLLSAAVLLFAWHTWWPSTPMDKSIAVLAFENMSTDPDQEYFSDGISEELLNALAEVPGLRVISRSSSFSYKGKDVDIPTIAKQLNVAHVLEGSVRKDENRVRITAQLIEARSDSHLWSETYDRNLEDIFEIQDEIASTIVGALTERLDLEVEAKPRLPTTANIEAHEAYLRGRYLMVQRTKTSIEGAVREFEQAISLDPEYALAHAELAIATLFLGFYSDLTRSDAYARAAPHTERAMALDPTLAESHAATGLLLYGQRNSEEALTHFKQAIQINPNYAIAYNWLGITLGHLGHYEEGFAARGTGLRLDPLSISMRANYVGMLISRNRLAEAKQELEKLASVSPTTYAMMRGVLTSRGGKWADSILGYLDASRINPQGTNTQNQLSRYLAAIGLEKEALAVSKRPPPAVLRMLGRPGDAATIAEARLAEDPIFLPARHDLGLALASAGDYVRARPILEEMWQRSGRRVTAGGVFQAHSAAALITIRRDAGEDAEVGELVAAIRDNLRRYHEAGITGAELHFGVDYEAGLAAYLAGERDRGLALIAKAAEDGFFIWPSEAYLQALYDDPGFAPIRTTQEARQARERERFLTIVCIDNPYEPVWQPAEGTCNRYAAASGS